MTDDPRAVEPLIAAMLDQRVDLNGRCYVIDTLARLKDPRAIEPLVTALSDDDAYIQSHAARALNALEDQDESWRFLMEDLPQVLDVLRKKSGN